jgi:hypothetical protein
MPNDSGTFDLERVRSGLRKLELEGRQ